MVAAGAAAVVVVAAGGLLIVVVVALVVAAVEPVGAAVVSRLAKQLLCKLSSALAPADEQWIGNVALDDTTP